MKILMVLTSHDKLGISSKKTGFWLEEFAAPYYVFKDSGAAVTLASPLGGQPPVDPNSDTASAQTDATRRFKDDASAQIALANTLKLRNIKASDFGAVFYPGGHGSLWDLAENAYSMTMIETMLGTGKPVGLVCHAPAALHHVIGVDGNSVVRGKSVTGFSNTEEKAAGLVDLLPFLVEDMLRKNGGHYAKAGNGLPFVVTDGLLVTGQNPASSAPAAQALLAAIKNHSRARAALA